METAYEEAMMIELALRKLTARRQVPIALTYKGHPVPGAVLDLLVEDELVVEIKAVSVLAPIHTAQVISYLKAGAFQLGLLINFNVPTLKQGVRRVISSG